MKGYRDDPMTDRRLCSLCERPLGSAWPVLYIGRRRYGLCHDCDERKVREEFRRERAARRERWRRGA